MSFEVGHLVDCMCSPLLAVSAHRKTSDTVTKVVNPFDWTYTTTYIGTDDSKQNVCLQARLSKPTVSLKSPSRNVLQPLTSMSMNQLFTQPKDHPGIPLAVLSRQDPILFFDEVTLFEDELHDNGMASLQVKVVSQ